MTRPNPYDTAFYELQKEQSYRSAQIVVPKVLELVEASTVVDLGCGIGTWLRAWREAGVDDVLGLDGDYVQTDQLMIPSELFRPTDLKEPVTLERRFDLAMSLEVAEHLPESCAEPFVESLTKLSDVVLFSAAIPLQGGDEHIHERWHDYWVELFEARGYRPIDALRPQLWNNPDVDIWYVQNLLLFANDAGLAAQPKLAEPLAQTRREQLSMVHPEALVILARNYAKKTVSFSKLARWRLAGLNDENYRRDRKINRTMRYQRTLPLPTDPPSEP